MSLDKSEKVQMVIWWTGHPTNFPSEAKNIRLPVSPLYRKRPLQNVQFCPRSRKTRILTTGILLVFRGVKFESKAEIGQKGTFFKGLSKGDKHMEEFRKPRFSYERWGFFISTSA